MQPLPYLEAKGLHSRFHKQYRDEFADPIDFDRCPDRFCIASREMEAAQVAADQALLRQAEDEVAGETKARETK